MLTIAFDDAYRDTYKYAIKYLDKYNIKSTIALPATFIGKTFENRPVINLKELKALVKSGHEIASHTLTHPNLTRLDIRDAISEIAQSKKMFERRAGAEVTSFVFPYIKASQTKALRLSAKSYYASSRITYERPCFNKIPVKDPYNVKGFAVMKKHSLAYLNKRIDYAEKNKLWLIEVFHLVAKKNTQSAHRPKPYRFFMHINDFKKHIDYVLSKNVSILTQKSAVFEKDTAGLSSTPEVDKRGCPRNLGGGKQWKRFFNK